MSAGNFTLFNIAKTHIFDDTINLSGHAFKMALCTNVQSIDATFLGASTDCRYSDLTAEVATGNGYTTGGTAVTISLSRSVGTVTVGSTSPSWSAATFTAKYGIIYDNTSPNKNLLGFVDLETTSGTGVSPNNGTLTVTVNGSGLFTAS